MNVVILHVHERRDVDGADWWIASPALAPDERVVVWRGLPPALGAESRGVAPVVLVGEVDGRLHYAERVPRGISWADAPDLPPEIAAWVSIRVLGAVLALHRGGYVHGAVSSERVMLGEDGAVVLFGAGRRGATQAADLAAVPPPIGDPAADAPARLAAWVRERLLPPQGADMIAMVVRPETGSDEVVPDLGPDHAAGILDRWAVTTATGRAEELTPAAMGLTAFSAADRFEIDTWARLAAPLPPGRADRFDGVGAAAARSIRALLADEAPESLPAMRRHAVSLWVGMPVTDDPTIVGVTPPTEFTAPGDTTTTHAHTESSAPRWGRAAELAVATVVGAVIAGLALRAC